MDEVIASRNEGGTETKTVEELLSMNHNQEKLIASLISELDVAVRYRDQALVELKELKLIRNSITAKTTLTPERNASKKPDDTKKESDHRSLRNRVVSLQMALSSAGAVQRSTHLDNERLKNQLHEHEAGLHEKITALQQLGEKIDYLTRLNKEQAERIDVLLQKGDVVTRERNEAFARIAQERALREQESHHLHQRESELEAVQHQNVEFHEAIRLLQEERDSGMRAAAAFEKQLEELRRATDDTLAKLLDERDAIQQQLNEANNALHNEQQGRQNDAAVAKAHYEKLHAERESDSRNFTEIETALNAQLGALGKERDRLLKENETQSAHLVDTENILKKREGHLKKFVKHRHQLRLTRDKIKEQLAATQKDLNARIAQLETEKEEVIKDKNSLEKLQELIQGKLDQQINLLIQEKENFAEEKTKLSGELADTKASFMARCDELTKEKNTVIAEKADLAKRLEATVNKLNQQIETLRSEEERFAKEKAQLEEEISTTRDTLCSERDVVIAERNAVTTERDELIIERENLRKHLSVTRKAHQQEMQLRGKEHGTVLEQRDRALAKLEKEHASFKKQKALLSNERDLSISQRDELSAQLTHEQVTRVKQVAALEQEIDVLRKERDEILLHLEEVTGAQKVEIELLRNERAFITEQRDNALEHLEKAHVALGEDKIILIQRMKEAEEQLKLTRERYQEQLRLLAEDRDEILRERNAALEELSPFQNAARGEYELTGTASLNRYDLQSEIAHEEDETLVRAHDLMLKRDVILKMIHGSSGDNESAQRLVKEARTLAQLQHPNIASIHEIGVDKNGHLFYAMKPVSGTSLHSLLDGLRTGRPGTVMRFTLRRLLLIFNEVCNALAYAHSQGIVHRHLATNRIYIGDFGEVCVTGWELATNHRASRIETDEHPDIAALGQILYEIVTLVPKKPGIKGAYGMVDASRLPAGIRSRKRLYRNLVRIARRAMEARAQDSFTSVQELQREIDIYKETLLDSTEKFNFLRLFRGLIYRHPIRVAATATSIVAAGIISCSLMFGGDKKVSLEIPAADAPVRLAELQQVK